MTEPPSPNTLQTERNTSKNYNERVFVPITRNMNKLTTVQRNLCRFQKYEIYNARKHSKKNGQNKHKMLRRESCLKGQMKIRSVA